MRDRPDPNRFATILRLFRRDRRGNIALIFGFSLLPLLGCCGLAFDFGRVMLARYACQTAADAAALYASGAAKNQIQMSDGSAFAVNLAFTDATTRAQALFDAHVTRNAKVSVSRSVVLTQQDGLKIVATATFSISTSAIMGKLFGVQTFNASGLAKSVVALPAYTNVYMALDISQSMGLASTNQNAQNLYKIIFNSEKSNGHPSPVGCVFGCHVVESGKKSPNTYEDIAHANGISLRIDVLRTAVSETITTAQANAIAANTTNYQIALYTMGLSSANGSTYALTQLQSPTNNWALLQAAAAKIDLGPNNGGGTGDTYLMEPLADLRGKMAAGGDGTSAAKARQFLFIVTDGLRDVKCSSSTGHCTAAFDPTACTTFKNANITVVVIYTTYLPILNNPTDGSTALDPNYVTLVQPYVGQIAPNLKTCASPGWYVEATDGPALNAAIGSMFGKITQQATLTY